jgi:hypothetical protein
MLKKHIVAATLASALLIGGYAVAQPAPKRNIAAIRHPNLAAAQRLTAQAFARISAAQAANEYDMAGHAAKAKALLDEASNELKLAAEAANSK